MASVKQKVRISCVQICSITGEKEKNTEKMKSMIDLTIEKYPTTDLILFPELALNGNEYTLEEAEDMAESLEGPSINELREYARLKNVFLMFGFIERDVKGGKKYNTVILIDRHGEIVGSYRKMHLVNTEHGRVDPGDSGYPVFDTELGKIGVMICWDSAFPETARILALKGADYILVPAAWEYPMQRHWDLVTQARALDNIIYIAYCNRVGKARNLSFFGRSKIIDPLGYVKTEVVENEEAIISCEIDLDENKEPREGYYSLLRDRRPETYGLLIK